MSQYNVMTLYLLCSYLVSNYYGSESTSVTVNAFITIKGLNAQKIITYLWSKSERAKGTEKTTANL